VTVADAGKKDSFGAYVGADLDFARRFYLDSPWHLVGDVRVFWRGNENSGLDRLKSRESQWGRAAFGLRRLSAQTLAEVRLKGEVFDYELYQHVSAAGPEATFLWAATPGLHLLARGGLDRRVYSRDPGRNGVYGWAGGYLRFFFGAGNHEFLAGGRFLGASAERNAYGYSGWEATARILFKLPYGFELAPSAAYVRENYNGPATILEAEDRRDERLRLGGLLTYRINESWSLELSYQYAKNNSNSDLYDYAQHYVSSGIAWNF
jgi:hypothetical protein